MAFSNSFACSTGVILLVAAGSITCTASSGQNDLTLKRTVQTSAQRISILQAHKPVPIIVPPTSIQYNIRPEIPYKPFQIRDPRTHMLVAPGAIITLLDGRKMRADAYYAQLNKYEKAFNKLGYSLRQHGTVKVAYYRVNYHQFDQQAVQLRSKVRPYVKPFSLLSEARRVMLARRALAQPVNLMSPKPTVVRVAPRSAMVTLPLLHLQLGTGNSGVIQQRLLRVRAISPSLFRALKAKSKLPPLKHDPPSSTKFPENIDLGDPSSFAVYLHSYLEADGDSTGITFTSSFDSGGYFLGNQLDIMGMTTTVKSPLSEKPSATLSVSSTLLGVTVTPPSLNLPSLSLQTVDLIPDNYGNETIPLYTTEFFIGPVPCFIAFNGQLGFTAKIKVIAPGAVALQAELIPKFKVGVSLEAGVGAAGVVGVGIGGQLNFMDIEAPLSDSIALVPGISSNGGSNPADLGLYNDLTWNVKYDILSGKLYAFAFFGPFKAELTIFSWNGVQVANSNIFNVSNWVDLGIPTPAWLVNASNPTLIASGGSPPRLTALNLAATAITAPFTSYSSGMTASSGPLEVTTDPVDQNGNSFPCTVNYSVSAGSIVPDPNKNGEVYTPTVAGGAVAITASVPGTNINSTMNLAVASADSPTVQAITPDHGLAGGGTNVTVTGYDLVSSTQQLLFDTVPAVNLEYNPASSTASLNSLVTMSAVSPAIGVMSLNRVTGPGGHILETATLAPGYVNVHFPGAGTQSGTTPITPFYYYLPNVPVVLNVPLGTLPAYPGPMVSFFGPSTTGVFIPLQLWDASGNPLANQPIKCTTSGGSFNNNLNSSALRSETAFTDKNGFVSVSLTDNVNETDSVAFWNPALPNSKLTLNIPMLAGPNRSRPVPGGSLREVAVLINVGGGDPLVMVPVQMLNRNGDPLSNVQVDATATGAAVTSNALTDSNGIAHIFVQPTKGIAAMNLTIWSAAQPGTSCSLHVKFR